MSFRRIDFNATTKIANASAWIKTSEENVTYLNVVFNAFMDIQSIFVSFSKNILFFKQLLFLKALLNVKFSRKRNFGCEDVFIERKIDLCNLSYEIMNSMFAKFIMQDIVKKSDFEFKCPYNVASYSIRNIMVMDLPSVPFRSNLFVCANIAIFVKTADLIKFLNAINFILYVTL